MNKEIEELMNKLKPARELKEERLKTKDLIIKNILEVAIKEIEKAHDKRKNIIKFSPTSNGRILEVEKELRELLTQKGYKLEKEIDRQFNDKLLNFIIRWE